MRLPIYISIRREMGRFVWWQAAQLLWLLTKGGSRKKGSAAVPWRYLESPGAKPAGNLPDGCFLFFFPESHRIPWWRDMLSKHTSLKAQQNVCCCIDVLSDFVVKLSFGQRGCSLPLLDVTCCFSTAPDVTVVWTATMCLFPKLYPFSVHKEAYLFTLNVCLMSPGWFKAQTRFIDSAILPHLASKTRIKTHSHETTDNLPKRVGV